MNKIEKLKSIAKDILDENTPVYEHNVLKNFDYKKDCSIVTIRQDIKELNSKEVTVEKIIKILNKNLY